VIPNSRTDRGFTLIELVVTIAVLVILAGVIVPSIADHADKGKNARAAAEMREVSNAFNQYRVDTGIWPANGNNTKIRTRHYDLVGLECLFSDTLNRTGWDGPYLNKGVRTGSSMVVAKSIQGGGWDGFVDPWGKPYRVYTYRDGWSSTKGGVVVLCAGQDGKFQSKPHELYDGTTRGDDVMQIVSYRL